LSASLMFIAVCQNPLQRSKGEKQLAPPSASKQMLILGNG
jgi:hypothetical protein